jgi:hypothetical protein
MNSDKSPLYVYTSIKERYVELRQADLLFEIFQGNSLKWVSIYCMGYEDHTNLIIDLFYLSRMRPNLLVETSLFRQVIQLFHWLNGTAKFCEVNLTTCPFDFRISFLKSTSI